MTLDDLIRIIPPILNGIFYGFVMGSLAAIIVRLGKINSTLDSILLMKGADHLPKLIQILKHIKKEKNKNDETYSNDDVK